MNINKEFLGLYGEEKVIPDPSMGFQIIKVNVLIYLK